MAKRGEDAVGGQLVEAKRPRTELVASGAGASGGGALAVSGPARTSDLLSPIMLLTGHTGQVLTTKFSPDGKHLLSGSHDKLVLLWEVFGECKNTLTLKGHQNAVLELHWSSDGEHAFTASADKTVALWDTATGGRVRQFKGHQGFVNTVCPARDGFVLASGSDDGSARLWDARVRTCARVLGHPFPVTAVSMSHDGDTVYTGCLDGLIRVYDVRRPGEPSMVLEGHQDIVTGLRVSPDADFLLSNAMDNTLRCWDVKPYASGDRCTKIFLGAQARADAAARAARAARRPPAHASAAARADAAPARRLSQHSYEKSLLKCNWSASGKQVACGSADNFVYVWDATTGRIAYKLPGHHGSVNEVDFHPTQPIIASCGNDKQIFLGEIKLAK